MDPTFDQGRLVSTMAFALRHDPGHFGLDLDEEGWANFEDLIIAIRFERYDWACVDESLVKRTIADMDRFEIRDGRIRAVYGHSVELVKPPAVATPPSVLFHGTASDNVPSILQQGILRMRRRFTHFSTDYDWVVRFLSDKPMWSVFAIETPSALKAGVLFRKANRNRSLPISRLPVTHDHFADFFLVHLSARWSGAYYWNADGPESPPLN